MGVERENLGEQGLEGFDGLVEQIAGYLVVDIHDLAYLFVAEILEILQIYDLLLPVGELVEGV